MKDFLLNNYIEIISVISIFELFVRLKRTKKNYSISDKIKDLFDLLIPNNKK